MNNSNANDLTTIADSLQADIDYHTKGLTVSDNMIVGYREFPTVRTVKNWINALRTSARELEERSNGNY